jgi:hypothetical protein
MLSYCIDSITQPGGEHLLHKVDCPNRSSDCQPLGSFPSFAEAQKTALKQFSKVKACYACLPAFVNLTQP